MKKNIFRLFGLFAVLSLSACSNEELLSEPKTTFKVDYNDVQLTESTLSVDEALNNMNFVYRNFDKEQQKERRVRTVELLKSSHLRSLTRSGNTEDVPLAYIVNFENENGYAILGADDRMPPIIMLGDEGSFSLSSFADFMQETKSEADFEISTPQNLQYAMIANAVSPMIILPPGVSTGSNPRDTTMVLKAWPLVNVKYDQIQPYNHFAPPMLNGIRLDTCVAGCSPVAMAMVISSVAYHHNHWRLPSIQGKNGVNYEIDWQSIVRSMTDTVKYAPNQLTRGSLAIAYLIRAIGAYSSTTYGLLSSETFLNSILPFLTSMNFSSVHCDYFSKDKIYDMVVNKRLPVFADGYTTDSMITAKGHSFVIDGWLRLEYTKDMYIADPITNLISNETMPTQYTFDLVHCNFGWGGKCDGYFTPGAFDLRSSEFWEYAEEFDESQTNPESFNVSVFNILYDF